MFHTKCESVWSEDLESEGRATSRCFKEARSPNLLCVTETWKEIRLGSKSKIPFTQLTRKEMLRKDAAVNSLQNIDDIWTEFLITPGNGGTVGPVCLSVGLMSVCVFGMSYRPESLDYYLYNKFLVQVLDLCQYCTCSVSEVINKKKLDQDYRLSIRIWIIFE